MEIKRTLVISVTYEVEDDAHSDIDILEANLGDIAQFASENGLFTDNTGTAALEYMSYRVEKK